MRSKNDARSDVWASVWEGWTGGGRRELRHGVGHETMTFAEGGGWAGGWRTHSEARNAHLKRAEKIGVCSRETHESEMGGVPGTYFSWNPGRGS